jgi:hypothetical protein
MVGGRGVGVGVIGVGVGSSGSRAWERSEALSAGGLEMPMAARSRLAAARKNQGRW